MYDFARAATANFPTEWLNNRNLSSYSSGGSAFKIKGSLGLVSAEASLLGLHMATFSLRPHMVFPLCVMFLVSLFLCPNFLFFEGHQSVDLGPISDSL